MIAAQCRPGFGKEQNELEKLVALPASYLRVAKRLMKEKRQEQLASQIEAERRYFEALLVSNEAKEAFRAFAEKRKPDFLQFDAAMGG
jgi:enoyl-CoA hydratase/carnithine racemase